ncbi:MAG: hypothetical protein ABIJ56_23605 [Pseudomonadota bacterium]
MSSASGRTPAGLPALVIAAALTAVSCGGKEACDKPREVIEVFFGSIDAGDRETAFNLLDKESRSQLRKIAEETTAKTGRPMEPHEMIVPKRFDKRGEIKEIIPVKEGGEVKSLKITFTGGESAGLPLSREGNCYKIHLEL